MPNLVCFPHYTCGALICDIMMDKISPIESNGAIGSVEHRRAKFKDSHGISIVDPQIFQNRIAHLTSIGEFEGWMGTHAWPGQLPLNDFEKVLVITTVTDRSKIYRWSRAYRHLFLPQWQTLDIKQHIDKARETAKNYLAAFDPVFKNNVTNIEFADIVETTAEFIGIIKEKNYHQSLARWQRVNNFLFDPNFWNTDEAKFFYQAQVEHIHKRKYVYE